MRKRKIDVILPPGGNVIYVHHAGRSPHRHTGDVSYHNVIIFCPDYLGITQQTLIQSSIQSGVVGDRALQIEAAASAVGALIVELRRVGARSSAEEGGYRRTTETD